MRSNSGLLNSGSAAASKGKGSVLPAAAITRSLSPIRWTAGPPHSSLIPNMTALETLTAKDQITTRIHDVFIGTDQHDWAKVRACFTEQVHFDMTSLAGGSPEYLTPRQITDSWQAGFQALEHVHHQAGNLQIAVNRNTAEAFCYGIALHYRTTKSGENVRRFVGSYDFTLQHEGSNWLISSFRFNVKFVDGNLTLETSP